ncbi:MAG: phenylacetate--CoA ligase family protein [Bacteroidota bacterium]|nr:phenylacetate--CoA ligase family protein [Bacteroidota bacterium]MDX5428159.1 phenylacetate--CoA ligase family protein [Bacteroidota bacterium]MDX5448955.1 phenylacetate--CoA ligase family protein [Bacteroidota bacterium]
MLHSLKESESFSREQLISLQREKLIRLIQHAFDTVPFYRKILDQKNWKKGVESDHFDITDLPVITKDDLIRLNNEFHSETKFSKRFLCETSGTSGKVLTFYRNEEWDSFNRAAIFRGYSWYGVQPWDFNIYFWGYGKRFWSRLKLRLLDRLVNRYRIFEFDEKAMRQVKDKISKAVFIEGYSSMIYELGKSLAGEKLDTSNLRMIKGTSEKVFPHYQDIVEGTFGMRIINEYGAAESGIIAFECPQGCMHINMEGVFIEVQEDGEILVTNLESYSFPIIRYKLGDSVRLSDPEKRCNCGMAHPVIEEVNGRVGKVIYGRLRKYPSLKLYYIFKGLYFEHDLKINYQGYQDVIGVMELRLDRYLSSKEDQLLTHKIHEVFSDDLKVELVFDQEFREEKGKLRDFISKL